MNEDEQAGWQATALTAVRGIAFWACAFVGFAHLLGWNWNQCVGAM